MSVEFLSNRISSNGITTQLIKVETIMDWLTPPKSFEVRSFLELTGWYCQSVSSYATIEAPLYRLTHQGRQFESTHDSQLAGYVFNPTLAYPDAYDGVGTCASNEEIGDVLSKIQPNGKGKSISYVS